MFGFQFQQHVSDELVWFERCCQTSVYKRGKNVVGDQRTESREERALCFFVHWKGTLEGTLSFIYHWGIQEGTFTVFFQTSDHSCTTSATIKTESMLL